MIFPNGTVASHLIVGLEPFGSTIKGVDYLTRIGVIPILPVYRPRAGARLSPQYSRRGCAGIRTPLYGSHSK